MGKPDIIYEDNDIIVCYKPAGIVRYCLKKKLSLGGQIYGIKPAWPEGEFYFYLVVLSGQQASSPTNTFHACGMIE